MIDCRATVSIGLPVYNGKNFVAEAIESVLGQSFGDFELLISDNGSTDGTEEICRSYTALDKRVRYHRSAENRGAAWNFTCLVQLAEGKYFKWLAHDDLMAPSFLEDCIARLEERPDAVSCMPDVAVIDGDSRHVVLEDDRPSSGCATQEEERIRLAHLESSRAADRFRGVLMLSQRCYEVFGLIRSSAIRRSGAIRSFNGSEKVLLAELALQGPFLHVPKKLFFSRWHEARFSANASGAGQNRTFDPAKSKRFALPHELRCTLGYFALLPAAALKFGEYLACLGVLARFVVRPRKWGRIVAKFVSGRSNTATLPVGYRQGDAVEFGRRRCLPAQREDHGETISI